MHTSGRLQILNMGTSANNAASYDYVTQLARFRFEAESLLCSTTVEIDVNGDGFGEVPINFSSTNTLWA